MTVSGVGSSSSQSSTSADRTTIAGNFDTFLQLLTTQLKNQNPLDPLDTNQFTQQLVQFSGVEQQLKTNDFLSSLVSANATTTNSNAVGYIGKTVTVNIKDAKGNSVYVEKGTMQAGTGTFTWDGLDSQGNVMPPGTYSISMQAVDPEGKSVNVSTETSGIVTGVDFTGTEPVLLVGQARLNISGVTSVKQTPAS
jgi:flagellar basal-body rod modification protein FlgD